LKGRRYTLTDKFQIDCKDTAVETEEKRSKIIKSDTKAKKALTIFAISKTDYGPMSWRNPVNASQVRCQPVRTSPPI
jgi:hypothetical protein